LEKERWCRYSAITLSRMTLFIMTGSSETMVSLYHMAPKHKA
jgi:hypothetical protein